MWSYRKLGSHVLNFCHSLAGLWASGGFWHLHQISRTGLPFSASDVGHAGSLPTLKSKGCW